MRNLLVCIFIACVSFSLQGRTVNGIRISAGDNLVIVYMDGKQISQASTSCFIANLTPGRYLIEVYDATHYRRRPEQRGKRLFRERLYFNGSQIKDIRVKGFNSNHRPPYPSHNYPYPGGYDHSGVMSPDVFEEFYQTIEEASFSSKRLNLVKNAVVNTKFTSAQCVRLLEICSFDSDRVNMAKVLYPSVVDKESFFIVKKVFDFDSNTRKLDEFIKKYHEGSFR